MIRNSMVKQRGYMQITTMANMGRPQKKQKVNIRTPFNLTTVELKKKLCEKGPKGCNSSCENWGVCEYGLAWAERVSKT